MTLKVISPQEIMFEGEVKLVTLPGAMGAFTVLNNHASLISALTRGKVVYHTSTAADDDKPQTLDIPGGVVVVNRNIVSVCVN